MSIRFSKLYILMVLSKEHVMMHGGLRISTRSVIAPLWIFIGSPTRGLRTNGLKFHTLSLKSFMPDVTNCLECWRHQMRSQIFSVWMAFQYSRRVLIQVQTWMLQSVDVRAKSELVPIGPKLMGSVDMSLKQIPVIFAFSIFIGTVNLRSGFKSVE